MRARHLDIDPEVPGLLRGEGRQTDHGCQPPLSSGWEWHECQEGKAQTLSQPSQPFSCAPLAQLLRSIHAWRPGKGLACLCEEVGCQDQVHEIELLPWSWSDHTI